MKTSNGKSYNKQFAVCYIIYMMGGSFFHKCTFGSAYEEERLYLHYVEMPKQKQYECEERVLRAVSRMDKEFLRAIQGLNCQVKCSFQGDDCKIEFLTGGFESMSCIVDEDGRFLIEPLAAV